MVRAAVVLPDVYVVLAYAEQHRDVLGLDDVPLAEDHVLGDAPDDLRDIVAESHPYRILGFDQFHINTSEKRNGGAQTFI